VIGPSKPTEVVHLPLVLALALLVLVLLLLLLLLPQPAATRAVSPIAAIVIRTFTPLPPLR
jgi:lauroyl/myristoyl acyltransferase